VLRQGGLPGEVHRRRANGHLRRPRHRHDGTATDAMAWRQRHAGGPHRLELEREAAVGGPTCRSGSGLHYARVVAGGHRQPPQHGLSRRSGDTTKSPAAYRPSPASCGSASWPAGAWWRDSSASRDPRSCEG